MWKGNEQEQLWTRQFLFRRFFFLPANSPEFELTHFHVNFPSAKPHALRIEPQPLLDRRVAL